MSGISPGLVIYKLAFELSPIILVGGLAKNIPFGMLPIIAITEAANFVTGLLSGSIDINLDQYFAHFQPLSGSSLIDQQVGMYPFANQSVAANAVISQPLNISLLMTAPAQKSFGYLTKLATMIALQASLKEHNALGGTYTIATPTHFYTNCLMTGMRDVSSGETQQAQVTWQLDFVQPLLTLSDAQAAQNSLMSKITGGTQIDGVPSSSGLASSVGNPSSLASSSVIPASANVPGTGLAGAGGGLGG